MKESKEFRTMDAWDYFIMLLGAGVALYLYGKDDGIALVVTLVVLGSYPLFCDDRAERIKKAVAAGRCDGCGCVFPSTGGLCQECHTLAVQLYEPEPKS